MTAEYCCSKTLRHDVNVTEKLAVQRTRSKVRKSDCVQKDMAETHTQLLAGRPPSTDLLQ